MLAMSGHQLGPLWAVLDQDQAPFQDSGQDQEMDEVDGERVWEAAGGKMGFLEGTRNPLEGTARQPW